MPEDSIHPHYNRRLLSHTECILTSSSPGAANRSPDKCDADPAGARSINVDASRTLAAAAAAHNALLVYISTEYVFPGTPGEAPYEADAPAAPVNIYGQTKLDGEKAVLAIEDGNAVVLRLPLLYGAAESPAESGVNVLTYAVLKARDKNASEIDIDDWQKRYPTNTADVARVCVDIARKYTDASRPCEALPEILQFSSDFQVTRYQMCRILAGIMGSKTEKLKPKKEEAHSDMTATKRPFDTHMSNKVLMELGISTECIDFEAWWYVA